MIIPFSVRDELYPKLKISGDGSQVSRTSSTNKSSERLPGESRILLSNEHGNLVSFLANELTTPDLNKFQPYLWMVGTQSSTHITPLTEQIVRGRSIILTENPELHLLWINHRIYLKPVPKYLLSHSFWSFFFTSQQSPLTGAQKSDIVNAARGFLRSYAFLIRHKSDFKLAQANGLISPRTQYKNFLVFISAFESVLDSEVSLRYTFGELRLGRLNFLSRFVLNRQDFHKTVHHYGEFFAQYYAPISFVFGVFVILLNAMQVSLAVQQTLMTDSWGVFLRICRVFADLTLGVVMAVVLFLIVAFSVRALRELVFALKGKIRQCADGEEGT